MDRVGVLIIIGIMIIILLVIYSVIKVKFFERKGTIVRAKIVKKERIENISVEHNKPGRVYYDLEVELDDKTRLKSAVAVRDYTKKLKENDYIEIRVYRNEFFLEDEFNKKIDSINKIELTTDLLISDMHIVRTIILFSIFVASGIIVLLTPIIYCDSIKSLLLNMLVMSIISIPFCWIGIKNVLEQIKIYQSFKNELYVVCEDEVYDKSMTQHGRSSDKDDSYCQLSLKKYGKLFGKNITVKRREYNQTKIGDYFYLIFIDDKLNGFYPKKKYIYSGKLTNIDELKF